LKTLFNKLKEYGSQTSAEEASTASF
jgi:hypothetical protein